MEAITPQTWLTEEDNTISLSVADLQSKLTEIVQQVAAEDTRVILSQEGKKIAAVISMEAFEFLERMVEKIEDEMDIEEAQRILAETKPEEYTSYEQLRQEIGLG